MIRQVELNTLEFQKKVTKKDRKSKAQFFTTLNISEYMSSLVSLNIDKNTLFILDPGAGTGILTCSLIDKLLNAGFNGKITVDLYENDDKVLEVLKENLKLYTDKHSSLKINIFEENFILANKELWEDKKFKGKYDIVIANPPYKKLTKSSDESVAMLEVVYGQPNIYFLFMAMAIHLLKNDGEMVFITPRSFTSGAYFKAFREYFLDNITLSNIHIFNSRNNVFKGEEVLQETIITKAIKRVNAGDYFINITVSENSDLEHLNNIEIHFKDLVTKCENRFILLPSTQEEVSILHTVSKYKNNLIKLGFKLSTGKVVDFRALDYITNNPSEAVPLFWSDNFINNRIVNVENEDKFRFILSNNNTKSLIQENKDYILVKRFTSKEEARRIQPAVYNQEDFSGCSKIGIENHINYIEKIKGDMTKEEQYGLFCIFNSSIIDKYYRIVNGNTQVNATEFNSIPMPDIETILKIGIELLNRDSLSTETCDSILNLYM